MFCFYGKIYTRGPKENPTSERLSEDDLNVENDWKLKVQTIFNEVVYQKKQKLVSCMRFENPKHLKHMLCNYAIGNDYQLWYRKW